MKLERVFEGQCHPGGRRRLLEVIFQKTPEGFHDAVESHMFLAGLGGKNIRVEIWVEEDNAP